MHRYHYIFESWKNDLNKLKKPTHRLTMARFLMLVYRLDNLLERNVFHITDPSEVSQTVLSSSIKLIFTVENISIGLMYF